MKLARQTSSVPSKHYLAELRSKYKTGKATEHTYRAALQNYVEALVSGVQAVNEPKRVKCGAPDYIVSKGRIPLGYIEAKDIGENLDKVEKSDQLTRYFSALSNLILTDYLEFRWYVNGEHRITVKIGSKINGDLEFNHSEIEKLETLISSFVTADVPTIKTATELAQRLAGTTKSICGLIETAFELEEEDGWLHRWHKAFTDVLIAEISASQFADMFAQTLAHGFFAARIHHNEKIEFSRFAAAKILPNTNPFLRRLFAEFVGVDMPDTINWAVDEIVELLKRTNTQDILADFGKQSGREDPIIHFYEPFLHNYNPDLKQRRGVFYTPSPVVNYLTRSVDELLKSDFGRADGLADDETVILDPAVGTGSFLHKVVEIIQEKFAGNEGSWDSYVKDNLLGRLFGFEILMAPYSVAHLNLGLQLSTSGYKFDKDQRLGIFLTNSLEESARKTELLLFDWISQEANSAAHIKKGKPIMVVLGNPPYSIKSQNNGDWIENLLKDYKKGVDDGKLNLDDDFIKFVKFAQCRIQETGHGVVAYITSNTFLDGMNHRRMRESLLETFSDIYILNLHGSVVKSLKNGDENVFDIQQGVSISVFVRQPGHKGLGNVKYADLVGSRDFKYDFLDNHTVGTTEWTSLMPVSDRFFFVPKDLSKKGEFDKYWAIDKIFKVGSSGTQTKRDSVFVDVEKEKLHSRMAKLLQEGTTPENLRQFDLAETSGWDPGCLAEKTFKEENIRKYTFRPFDDRWVYYDDDLLGRSRYNVLKHMLKPNLALVTLRQTVDDHFRHVFCTENLVDINLLIGHHVSDQVFPLYLYNSVDDELATAGLPGRIPNFDPEFLEALSSATGLAISLEEVRPSAREITPEDIFAYIYGILHSKMYRERYDELLKISFPRIPLPTDKVFFRELSTLGRSLIEVHTFKLKASNGNCKFPIKGDNIISTSKFDTAEGKLWINKHQFFTNISEVLWNHKVGGYQVLAKWLKDRKGNELSYSAISKFQEIVSAILSSLTVFGKIDEALEKAGGWPLNGSALPVMPAEAKKQSIVPDIAIIPANFSRPRKVRSSERIANAPRTRKSKTA